MRVKRYSFRSPTFIVRTCFTPNRVSYKTKQAQGTTIEKSVSPSVGIDFFTHLNRKNFGVL